MNPELKYCAIAVDEVEPAKKILERVGLPQTLLKPLYELKDCVRDMYYDYVLCVEDDEARNFSNVLREYAVPKNKIVELNPTYDSFLIERSFRYFKEHAAEFEMFATGMSYIERGLDVTQFRRKLFNFARVSQDLYYNFLTAKTVISYGGHIRFRYALIGLAPYSFHYDGSKVTPGSFLMLHYLIAFNDLHNFFVPMESYRNFLREDYFEFQAPLDNFDLNNPHYAKPQKLRFINKISRLNTRKRAEEWAEKNYPETRDENIKILDDYLALCEDNAIRPIMFLPPMTEGYTNYFNKKMLDEFYCLVEQACKKHSTAIFIDGWELKDLMNDSDFYDCDHMNNQGAAKFSAFLNDFIELLEEQGV